MASESDRPGKIMVAGIPMSETFTEADLEKEFAPFGRITEVLIVTDKRKGKPRGFAFVTYENPKDAQDAMKAMTGKDIGGNKPLRCEQAKIAEHNRQENVMDDSRGRGRGRGFRGGENMTRGRGGFRGDERGRGRFRGDYRGRGGFRHDDRGRGGFRGDDRGRGGFRGDDRGRGGFRSDDRGRGGFRGDDRGRGGFRGDDFGRGGGFRVGLLDRGRGRRVGREEYHEEEYRGDEFQEHHFEDVRRPPLQRLPIGGVRGVPGRKTLLPPPSWSGPGRGGQNDGVEEYYNEEGNDWYSGEGNTRAYRDGQEESYGAEYNDDYYEQDDYQDSYEESRSVRGGGRGRASLRHPGRGGMEPPRRGGMGPLRREELESPRRGEIDSILGRGDMGPPRRGNAGPLRRGEMEPARRGEMESVRRGEMEPRRRGDMEPLRRGEVEPPRRSVPTPSRRIHEYGEDESVDAAHRRPARYDERYLGMRGENGGREQGDWAAQEREGQSDYAYHREEEDYWEEGQGDESYRLPPGKMTGRGGLEMGGPRRKPLLEAEHRLGASNEGYEEGDYSGPLPYGRKPPAHPEERYREDGSEGGMMTGGRGVRRPPPGDGGRYDDDRYPGEPNIDPSRRDGYREERRAPLMKRPNESYPPHRRSDEMYPGPQSNRDYDYDPQSRKRPMDDDNFRMSNDIVALRRQYENILERTGGGPPIVKRERFDGYQGHP